MNEPQQRPSSGDIDLKEIFSWIGEGIASIGQSFLLALAGLRNIFFSNRLFFFGIIGLGLALGTVYSELLKRKHYKSTMVLSCDYLNTQVLQNTIDKLNLLCAEPEREGLSEALHIEASTAKNILKFEFEPFVSEDDVVEMEVLREQLNNVATEKKEIVDKVISKLKIENKNAYKISALVYSPEIVKTLEKSVINFFLSSEYIRKRIQVNESGLNQRRTKLIAESKKLDSLKSILAENYRNVGKATKGSGNVIVGEEGLADPLAVFTTDLEVNKEILEIDRQLYIKPDFEVVDGFTTFKQPESASLLKILFVSFWISFVMGYVIIGAWRLDKKLASYNTK